MKPRTLVVLGVVCGNVVVTTIEIASLSFLDVAGDRLHLDAVANGAHSLDECLGGFELGADELSHNVPPVCDGTTCDEWSDNVEQLVKRSGEVEILPAAETEKYVAGVHEYMARGKALHADGRLASSGATHKDNDAWISTA